MMKRYVDFFEKPGRENTARCMEIITELAKEGVKDFVVASTTGETGVQAAEALEGVAVNLVVVGHSVGLRAPNQDEFLPENLKRIEELGGRVFKGTILTSGLAAFFGDTHPSRLIANTLRRLGQGMKVVCEIVMEACDAGLMEEDREVAAVAGTGRGADTVTLIRSTSSKRFLELVVLEILAKPRG
jgi:hypothetical protein